jgi:DNA-binding transcriptional MerR regulator
MFILALAIGAMALAATSARAAGDGDDVVIAPEVDDVATVPKQYQSLYAKGEDGKYKLDPVLAKRLDNTGLTKALDSERKAAKEMKAQIRRWTELGMEPEDIKAKLEKIREIEEKNGDTDGRTKGALDKIKKETEQTIQQLKTEHEARVREMGESLATHLIEKEAISALASAKGSVELLSRLITDQCVLLKEDGKYVVRVVDDEGDPRSDGRGGYLSIEGLVAEMRANPKYARAFESSGRSGGGMPQGSGTGKGAIPSDKLTPQQKIERGLSQLPR